ncbi:hypothetical protein [Ensifer sp. 4252]|uniref:hypothetical protein n=1 Tax=Ensifer sp. 4252 TaxID=3373915 RepID=UPI003D190641
MSGSWLTPLILTFPAVNRLYKGCSCRLGCTNGWAEPNLDTAVDGKGRQLLLLLSDGQMSDRKPAHLVVCALPSPPTLKAPAVGSVKVPTPVLATPSVIALNYGSDETFKSFVSAWGEYNRRIGNNQTWIVKSLEPFGITLEDMPVGFGFGG